MERLAITGASGFIGRNLAKSLKSQNLTILQLDRISNDDVEFLDITSQDCAGVISEFRPNIVVHLAAQVDVRQSFVDPLSDMKINVIGTLNVLKGAIDAGTKNFVYVTSGGAMYDINQNLPIPETGRADPISPYGISKSAGEDYVRILCTKHDINWTSLALSNCYGPVSDHKVGVIYEFWKGIVSGQKTKLNGEKTTRDFIYIDDVLEAIKKAMIKPTNCRVNISTSVETSLSELFEMCKKVLKNEDCMADICQLDFGEISRSALDNSLAKELLNWAPKTNVFEGLEKAFNLHDD